MKKFHSLFERILMVAITVLVFVLSGCQKQEYVTQLAKSDGLLTIEDAITEVKDFLKAVEPTATRAYGGERRVASTWVKSLDPDTQPSDANSPKLFIMNFEDSLGFAIVSNDPNKGVLGLSLSGSFKEGQLIENPGFEIILEQLEAFARAPMIGDSIDHFEYGSWEDTYYAPITGYCAVRWNQGSSSGNQYNAYCPIIDGIKCPAGCGPVAVAQLMSMYKFPSSYGAYAFNWDSMISNSSATDNYGDYYVGRLLQQIGLSQNMNVTYNPSGSSSYASSIPHTFENFGYANGGTFGYLYSHNAIQDLKGGYPIIITGETTAGDSHAWVAHGVYDRTRECIGYSANGEIQYYGHEVEEYILHNFGWGGWGNGYYLLNNYNTTQGPTYYDPTYPYYSQGGYNFVNNIKSVYGIRRY